MVRRQPKFLLLPSTSAVNLASECSEPNCCVQLKVSRRTEIHRGTVQRREEQSFSAQRRPRADSAARWAAGSGERAVRVAVDGPTALRCARRRRPRGRGHGRARHAGLVRVGLRARGAWSWNGWVQLARRPVRMQRVCTAVYTLVQYAAASCVIRGGGLGWAWQGFRPASEQRIRISWAVLLDPRQGRAP